MRLIRLTISGCIALLILISSFTAVSAQQCRTCKDKAKAKEKARKSSKATAGQGSFSFKYNSSNQRGLGDFERAMKVNKNVVMSFCVIGAPVRVNGWRRSEIRAFVRGARTMDFKVRGISEEDKKPVWVEIKAENTPFGNCLRGKSIEIDAPIGSTLTISGRSGNTSVRVNAVDSVAVNLNSGDISLSNISRSIVAKTNVGAITVRNSKGNINLSTTAGNIIAYDTKPARIGDPFKASSVSGMVMLNSVSQKEVRATSISGRLHYRGELFRFGNYEFRTTSGLISLVLPPTSSFQLKANYGGSFVSQFDLKNLTKRSSRDAVSLRARVGEGKDCSVSTNSYSGSITLKRSDLVKKSRIIFPRK